jgi:hypothetical protein
MTTPAAPVPGPPSAGGTGNPAGDAATAAADPGDTVPGAGDLLGSSGQEPLADPHDDEDDEYEPLV